MKKLYILILLLNFAIASVFGQNNITYAEYYIDNDPGFGAGTAISISTSNEIDASFSINTSGLSQGIHTVYIRVQREDNSWSLLEGRNFFIKGEQVPALEQRQVVASEYFFNTDPGLDNGTPITVVSGDDISESASVSTAGLPVGFHTLYIRVRDNLGRFSELRARNFYITGPPVAALTQRTVNAAEYYIDSDPGLGSAIPLPVNSGESISESTALTISEDILPGFHTLYIRVKDDQERFGGQIARNFYVNPVRKAQFDVTGIEVYYGTVDPGLSRAIPVDLPGDPAPLFNGTAVFPLDTFALGEKRLNFRVKDESGLFSARRLAIFTVTEFVNFFERDSTALVALYDALGGEDWTNKENWLVGVATDWEGVTFEGERVIAFVLPSNNLNGTIPADIAVLDSLKILDLADNQISGIASEFGSLSNLRKVNLTNNQLSEFPEINTSKLDSIDLSGNHLQFIDLLPYSNTSFFAYLPQGLIGQEKIENIRGGTQGEVSIDGFRPAPGESYVWSKDGNPLTGNNIYPLSLPDLSRLDQGAYSLEITHPDLPDLTLQTATVNVFGFADIRGAVVRDNGQAVNDGQVVLFQKNGSSIDSLQASSLDSNGAFNFDSLALSDYVVLTIPNRAVLTLALDTYFESTTRADEASVIELNADIDIEILLKELLNLLSRDSLALVEFYQALDGENWNQKSNWLSGNVRDWHGITLQLERVVSLILPENNLSGHIPNSFGNLDSLAVLDLSGNQILSLPDSLVRLSLLNDVNLSSNEIPNIPWRNDAYANLETLKIEQNRLQFIHLLPFVDLDTFSYAPQKPIGVPQVIQERGGNALSINSELIDISGNTYQWLLNDIELADASTISLDIATVNQASQGKYTLKAQNELLPELTNESATIDVQGIAAISGNILAPNGSPLNSGNVVLLAQDSTGFQAISSRAVASNGNYNFGDVPLKNYKILLRPNKSQFPLGANTYFENALLVEDADTIFLNADFSANFSLLELIDFLQQDSLHLVRLYRDMGGLDWTSDQGWLTSPINNWLGVSVQDGRVSSLVLPNNNLVGKIPDDLGAVDQLRSVNLSQNNIVALSDSLENLLLLENLNLSNNLIPELIDINALTASASIDVSNNLLQFDNLLPFVTREGLIYAPQKPYGQAQLLRQRTGTQVNMSLAPRSLAGTTFQWEKDGEILSEETDSVLIIESLRRANQGDYRLLAQNNSVPGLTLQSNPIKLEGFADIFGKVSRTGGEPLNSGLVVLFDALENAAYDTLRITPINAVGEYRFANQALRNYVVLAWPNSRQFPRALDTYFPDQIFWDEAELIILDLEKEADIDLLELPFLERGDRNIEGSLERELIINGRSMERTRVSNARVTVRRSTSTSKGLDVVYEVVAVLFSDEFGEFRFSNLPPDLYRLKFDIPGTPMDENRNIDLDLRSRSGANVRATIIDNQIIVEELIALSAADLLAELEIFPNPSTDFLTFRTQLEHPTRLFWKIYNPQGQLMQEGEINGRDIEVKIDIRALNAGLYLLQIDTGSSELEPGNYRIIKR